jgi:uncharacterized membrane protein
MSVSGVAWLIVIFAFIAANLPWISDRFVFLFPAPGGKKKPWMRLLEWAILLCVVGLTAAGLEKKTTGSVFSQDWEFYAVGVCLFVVFALPGFIYRHELRKLLDRR